MIWVQRKRFRILVRGKILDQIAWGSSTGLRWGIVPRPGPPGPASYGIFYRSGFSGPLGQTEAEGATDIRHYHAEETLAPYPNGQADTPTGAKARDNGS